MYGESLHYSPFIAEILVIWNTVELHNWCGSPESDTKIGNCKWALAQKEAAASASHRVEPNDNQAEISGIQTCSCTV